MLEKLKESVYEANMRLAHSGLIVLTWGNVSAIDRETNLIIIKPSGVNYETMKIEDMVVCNLDGVVVEGKLRPSVDLLTHIEIYKKFLDVNAIVHDHSTYATSYAQANREIIPYGTTQADSFYGNIPLTRKLVKKEVENNYTKNTGLVIVERFKNLDYKDFPGCLVANHGVFCWGSDLKKALDNAIIIEECAKMAFLTESINKEVKKIPKYLLDVHYNRKHGKNKSYGQEEK